MNAYIVKKPVITEKTLKLASTSNVYTFEVAKTANKNQVKEAVESIFSVKVIAVNTVMRSRDFKKTGKRRLQVTMPKTKKAMVTLKAGDSINLFDIAKEA